jgi:acylphosphatase
MTKEFRAVVRGRVQMVMYRDFAQRKARKLNITGTVKNLPDKTVEIFAQGEEKDLEAYVKKLNRGSVLSHVEKVEVEWREPSGTFESFKIIY